MLRDDSLGSLKTRARIATAVGLIAVAGLASPAFGQSFVGEWTATATTPGGDVSESLKVVRTAGGYQITAKAVVPPAPGTPEAGPGTDIVIDRAPWFEVLLVSRSAIALISVGILALALTVLRDRAGPIVEGDDGVVGRSRLDGRIVGAIVLSAILDILGLASFSFGLETAETWLVGLASSFGPAVTIVVAVAFLGERLRPIQWVGLCGILIGMIAIGLP